MSHKRSSETEQLRRENEVLKSRLEQLEKLLLQRNAASVTSTPIDRSLFEDSPLPYHSLDQDGNIIAVNSLWLEMLGYAKHEVEGTYIGNYLTPESKASFSQRFPEFMQRGWIKDAELKFITKEGGMVDISVNGRIQHDANGHFIATHCILTNITLQKVVHEQLCLAEREWQITFDAISDPICLLSKDCTIIKSNKAFDELVDSKNNPIEGQRCYQLIHGWSKALNPNCPFFLSQQSKKREQQEADIKGHTYQLIVDPILTQEGEFIGAVHIFKDITQQQHAETALQRNNQRMESLLKVMQHESSSIQEFLDYALDEAIKISESKLGYIYWYDEVTSTFKLNSWSKEVMDACAIANPQTCYELEKTGLWGEAVRQRKAIILNDFDVDHPLCKGFPQGHARLTSFMTIPIYKGSQIMAVVGVANKPNGYDDSDVLQLTFLMDSARKVVERMQADEALRISEENFRSTMTHSPLGIRIVNNQSETVYANDVLLDMYGFNSYDEFNAPHPYERYTEQSYAEHIDRREKRKRGEYTPNEYEISIIRKNGDVRHLHVFRKEVMWNGEMQYQVVYQDITQRKSAEEQVIKLSRVTEQSPESIIITNTKGKIEYVNPKFSELTGFTMDELIGQNPRVLKSGMQSSAFYAGLWSTILSGHNWEGELHNRKKNGELYWEKAIISPIVNDAGQITHFVAVKEDITERKKMMAELVNAKERAEESDRLKSAFLANLSHEIRTPMNAILGFADLLLDTDIGSDKHESYINIIQKSGLHLLSIIGDIIEISRIETGQIILNLTQVDVNSLLRDICTEISVTIPADKEVKLMVVPSRRKLQNHLLLDEVKLRQILTNLITNALKFTTQGHVAFGYRLPGHGAIEFFVEDTGIGIDKAYHQLIFDRFRQVDDDANIKHGGSGLGLAISKAYVEKMGGAISLKSEKGKGARFSFRLPVTNGNLLSPETQPQIKSKPTATPHHELLLIAEDNDVNFQYLEEMFKTTSYRIIRAVNGQEAVDLCSIHDDIKLVLMDIKMPVLDGYEALKIIRKLRPALPVIAQTAYALSDESQKIADAGFNGYIPKPIQQHHLLEMINELLT
jgi:PAS domain S-box-containing protein